MRQCDLLSLPRSTYYYEVNDEESAENQQIMHIIDRIYMKYPYYGEPRITEALRGFGYHCNHKRIARLMRVMGIAATVPGPHTSKRHPAHHTYPYLLRGMRISRPNEVWCADITYLPLAQGYLYLMAVMDWYSRYVLSWEVSNVLETRFCIDALDRALAKGMPRIFNTDQGVQFTSQEWIGRLERSEITISMDGRGRALDNVMIERLWRSVKYEDIYVRGYCTGKEVIEGLERYFRYYNTKRTHSSLGGRTPREVYHGS